MTPITIRPADEFVERIALQWEEDGLPRIAGRIFGHLLLQPDACSLDELASALAVSKASVSVDARRLESIGLVERVGRPGDRRDYYTISPHVLTRVLARKLDGMRRMHDTITAARKVPVSAPAVRNRLATFEREHLRILRALESAVDELRRDEAASSD